MKVSSEYKRLATDKTGAENEIRPICHGDENALRTFYEGLSRETLRSYYRCSANKNFLAQEMIDRIDHENILIWSVFRDNEIAGIGLLAKRDVFGGAPYEISHLISDTCQNRGIGSLLMEAMLLRPGKGEGVVAQIASTNIGAKKLLKKFDFSFKYEEDGETTYIHYGR